MPKEILIIDDDSVDREAIRRCLSRPGRSFVIHEATTGQEGLKLMAKQAFDCVFLDYRLSDMDGVSLLRKIYNAETDLTSAPVVMLTGQGSESVMGDALRWGAQDYLIKDNISPDTVVIALAKAREIFELKKIRRQAEDRLRQSQKMEAVGQLTSGVAHDFNNLLTIILGNTYLMQRSVNDAGQELSREDLTKKIQDIEVAARRGADAIQQMMLFTRQSPPHREATDINSCVQKTCALLQRSLGKLVEINPVLANDVWPVRIDVGQFENALINLAVNARDAMMPKGGKLTVETHNTVLDEKYARNHPDVTPGSYAMVAVSDTGTGMTPSVACRIFEPFYTTKEAGRGTGLGLSMVHGFVRQSGGHVNVYSEEGHGTVFRIYLPRARPEDSLAQVPANSIALQRGTETILVVEDDDTVSNISTGMLGDLGYRTIVSRNAREALEILKREKIDLIFTDIYIAEGMNGAELVRHALKYYPQLKVLFTSGYTRNTIPDRELIAEQEMISKPYCQEDLAKKIRQVLDKP